MRPPIVSSTSRPTKTSYERAPSSTRTVSSLTGGTSAASADDAMIASPCFHCGTHALDHLVERCTGRIDRVRHTPVRRGPRREELADAREPLGIRGTRGEQRTAGSPADALQDLL